VDRLPRCRCTRHLHELHRDTRWARETTQGMRDEGSPGASFSYRADGMRLVRCPLLPLKYLRRYLDEAGPSLVDVTQVAAVLSERELLLQGLWSGRPATAVIHLLRTGCSALR
jgi:hypothetical protein